MTGNTKSATTETADTKMDIAKIKIGVSACLLGEKVGYEGNHTDPR